MQRERERENFNPDLMSHTKINPKWIGDLEVKPKTVKFPLENIGGKSLWPLAREGILRYNTKSMIYKRKENQ